ncbi:hypothetical protein SFC57_01705 [Niallia circulans]|uniref:hypothetical protein n=1 Tax=Niallia circulans TaxID=1397 RepID=UPI00397E84A8
MEINLFSTIITTIASIFTIFQITKEFIKPKSSALIQQENVSGDNYYIDTSTTINNSTTINDSSLHSYSNYGFENSVLIAALGLLATCILLSIYSLTYEYTSMIGLLILSITIYKDSKIPFENNMAKLQWAIQKITYITIIFILFFLPQSIEDIIIQVQALNVVSFKGLVDSIIYNINFLWDLYHNSMLNTLNVICRTIITLGLINYLIVSLITKRKIHKVHTLKESITFILSILIIIIGSNIEYFWNLLEPLRNAIETWFNSTP